jgi:hypothetical protein
MDNGQDTTMFQSLWDIFGLQFYRERYAIDTTVAVVFQDRQSKNMLLYLNCSKLSVYKC